MFAGISVLIGFLSLFGFNYKITNAQNPEVVKSILMFSIESHILNSKKSILCFTKNKIVPCLFQQSQAPFLILCFVLLLEFRAFGWRG